MTLVRHATRWIRRRLQWRILQRPGQRFVVVAPAHVAIDRVYLLILEGSEIRRAATAAGGGRDSHAVRGLADQVWLGIGSKV